MLLTEQLAKELSEKLSWFNIKEIGEDWTFKVVASDETVDRAGEVIKVSWRDLVNFLKNPVIIANHIYRVENIIWKATSVFVENDKLVVEWVFATTELAQDVRKLYDGGFIKTVSVGFIPLDRDENNPRIITRAELLEVSFVPVPCNPNALSLWKEVVEDLISKWLIIKEEEQSEEPKEEWNPNEEAEANATSEEWNESQENQLDNEEENNNHENEEEDLKSILSETKEILNETKSLLSNVKDLLSKDNADDNAGGLEDKDAKIRMQKEALQNVSKVVSDCLHKIKL